MNPKNRENNSSIPRAPGIPSSGRSKEKEFFSLNEQHNTLGRSMESAIRKFKKILQSGGLGNFRGRFQVAWVINEPTAVSDHLRRKG